MIEDYYSINIKQNLKEISLLFKLNIISDLIGFICLGVMVLSVWMPGLTEIYELYWVLRSLFIVFFFLSVFIMYRFKKYRKIDQYHIIEIYLLLILFMVLFIEVLNLHRTLVYFYLLFFITIPSYLYKNISYEYKNVKLLNTITEIDNKAIINQ